MIRSSLLAAAMLASPALAQPDNVPVPVSGTQWAIQAIVDSAEGVRRYATTPAAARTAAQASCVELGPERSALCLAALKARSLASLTAQGATHSSYYIDVERNAAGGRRTYVAIFASRPP